MKYSVITLAVVGAMIATTATAAPRVSGRIKPVLLTEKIDTTQTNLVNGRAYTTNTDRPLFLADSRFRISGSEKATKDWSFLYALEYNIAVDDGDKANPETGRRFNWSARSAYVGVEHKDYGRFRFGRQSLPGGDIDLVNASSGDAFGTDEPFSFTGDTRIDNSFQYASPKFGKGGKNRIKFQYGMDEGNTSNAMRVYSFRQSSNGRRTGERRDIAQIQYLHSDDIFSYGAFYTRAGDDFQALRGSMRYELPKQKMGFGLMSQITDYNSKNDEVGAMASATYYVNDDITLYAQAGHAQHYQGFKDGKHSVFSIGGSKYQKLSSGGLLTYAALSYDKLKEFRYASRDDVDSGFADARYELIKVDSKALGVEVGVQLSF